MGFGVQGLLRCLAWRLNRFLQVWDTALRDPIAYAEIETQVGVGLGVVCFLNERVLQGR